MKLKYKLVVNDVAGKKVAVAVGEDLEKFNGFIKTNQVGADILEILKNDVTAEQIIDNLSSKYPEVAVDIVRDTVSKFIYNLRSEGVIE